MLVRSIRSPGINPSQRHKLAVRLVQAMWLRETSDDMMHENVSTDSFKWLQQMKYTHEEDEIVASQLNRRLVYGLEYFPAGKITVPTSNYKLLLNKAHETSLTRKVMVVTGVEGDGKRNLVAATAREYGCFYKELVCNRSVSLDYLMRFVQGAVLAGAWLSFYEFEHLEPKVLVQLLNQVNKLIIKLSQPGDLETPTQGN